MRVGLEHACAWLLSLPVFVWDLDLPSVALFQHGGMLAACSRHPEMSPSEYVCIRLVRRCTLC